LFNNTNWKIREIKMKSAKLSCSKKIVFYSITLSQKKQTATVVLQLIIIKATNANAQLALFRVTNIWRNATLPAVRCKSFTFYQVAWFHFSGMVGKGV